MTEVDAIGTIAPVVSQRAEESHRVLVVDRDRELADRLSSVFRQHALTMDHAADAVEGRSLLDQRDYGVVLIDLFTESNLPELLESLSTRPVVLAFSSDRQRPALDPQRVHGVIRKPFDPHDLATIIRACVDIRARAALETMAAMLASGPLLSLVIS